MAAPHSVDPAALLEQHLQGASPDLVREMIATFANAWNYPDQRSHCLERHVIVGFHERVHPRLGVRVVAVYERAVDVEDYALKQLPYCRFF